MLDIKVLGPGCAKCYVVDRATAAAIETLLSERPDLEATHENIADILEIERYPILFPPALVVNERVVCAGRIPKKEEVIGWYRVALDQAN